MIRDYENKVKLAELRKQEQHEEIMSRRKFAEQKRLELVKKNAKREQRKLMFKKLSVIEKS